MGLAGGLLCAGQANAVENNQVKELLGNVSLSGSYGSLLAGSCGGNGGAGGCGHAAPQGQTISQGCAGKQIGGENQGQGQGQDQGYNSSRSQGAQQDYNMNRGQPQQGCSSANRGQSASQGHILSQGCGANSNGQQPSGYSNEGAAPQQAPKQLTQGCGAQRSQNNNNNNYYYTDAQQNSQNSQNSQDKMDKMDKGMNSNGYNSKQIAANEMKSTTNLSDPRMAEKDLMTKLNPQGKAAYQGLTPEGKALAVKLVNEDPAHDANNAVKKAADKMAEKRNGVLNRSMSQ